MIYRRLIVALLLSGCAVLIGGSAISLFFLNQWMDEIKTIQQDLPKLKPDTLPLATEVYDRHGNKIGEIASERRYYVPLNQIPKKLIAAFLTVEDQEFYKHSGVSFRGILRALHNNLTSNSIREGGSTITQQLIRNIYLQQERSVSRKVKELMLAVTIERQLTKDQILELYLNTIFLGNHSYGIEAAARNYFRKAIHELNVGEMAVLAGLPKAPSRYAPHRHPEQAKTRQKVVLKLMADSGFISRKEARKWAQKPLAVANRPESYFRKAPYFLAQIRTNLRRMFEAKEISGEGLKVFTTLDLSIHEAADAGIRSTLDQLNEKLSFNLLAQDRIEGASVSLDPFTGAVRSLKGGSDFFATQFDRSTNTTRQMSGTFLPFLMGVALEQGFTVATPVNYIPMESQRYGGDTPIPTLYEALLSGMSFEAARMYGNLGAGTVHQYLNKLDLNFDRRDFGIAVGQGEVSPLNLAAAYSAIASDGAVRKPYFIEKIVDRNGELVYLHRTIKPQEAFQPQTAYILKTMLQHNVLRGTATAAKGIATSLGGINASTDDRHNSWFVGLLPQLVTVTWIGAEHGGLPLSDSPITAADFPIEAYRKMIKAIPKMDPLLVLSEPPTGLSYARVQFVDRNSKNPSLPFVAGTEPPQDQRRF